MNRFGWLEWTPISLVLRERAGSSPYQSGANLDGATRWSTRWRCSRGMLKRDFRKHHEEDLADVQALMSQLRTMKQSAKRRFKCNFDQ
ncbi:hypothetical protein PC115_g14406 [Phytophthora cactorum]|uniref:Uncharacterized protein n=1 Tax=Phytophthora cactorum TaxID=29920 RepID=A0A8T1BRR7_9STRA|nr:hypothetical protein PC115_g14406 [Phytophthora cactorum]